MYYYSPEPVMGLKEWTRRMLVCSVIISLVVAWGAACFCGILLIHDLFLGGM